MGGWKRWLNLKGCLHHGPLWVQHHSDRAESELHSRNATRFHDLFIILRCGQLSEFVQSSPTAVTHTRWIWTPLHRQIDARSPFALLMQILTSALADPLSDSNNLAVWRLFWSCLIRSYLAPVRTTSHQPRFHIIACGARPIYVVVRHITHEGW